MHVKRARAAFRVHVCTADDAGMALHLTHIGTATLVIEIDGVRLLTDPAFDPPGATYGFGWGTRSRRLAGPALPAAALGPIDAVLLSHDQHADNLDGAGRALLPTIATVITTRAAARRLGHAGAIGLAPFAATEFGPLRITAAQPFDPQGDGVEGNNTVAGADFQFRDTKILGGDTIQADFFYEHSFTSAAPDGP